MDWQEKIQWALVPGLVAFDRLRFGAAFAPLEDRNRQDPYPMYALLRERAPWLRSALTRGWVVSRYEDVLAVLRDPRFSASDAQHRHHAKHQKALVRAGVLEPGETPTFSMLRSDPPDHTRLRNLVNKAFTPRAIEGWRSRIVGVVDGLVEQIAKDSKFELMHDFASPLPMQVIAEMLGVPPEDRDQFKAWSDDVVKTLGFATMDEMRDWRRASKELHAYLGAVAEDRRREPREDLITALVQAEDEGDRLGTHELLTTCELLLVAGNETTSNLIGNAMAALLRHPVELERLRTDPSLWAGAIDELLRFDSPVQATSRLALEDMEWRGRHIARGDEVIVLLASANRDETVFEAPDRLDVTRKDVRHLSFGQGVHYCLGTQLARLEATVALSALIERFPSLRLAEPGIRFRGNVILRGPERLTLRID